MPLSRFIFGGGPLILSLLPQKYQSFQNTSLPRFIFGGGYLILSLLPKKYSSFQNTSFRVYIRRQSFNPIHLFEISIWWQSFNLFQGLYLAGVI